MKSNKKQLDPNLENIIKEQDEVETYEKQKKTWVAIPSREDEESNSGRRKNEQ